MLLHGNCAYFDISALVLSVPEGSSYFFDATFRLAFFHGEHYVEKTFLTFFHVVVDNILTSDQGEMCAQSSLKDFVEYHKCYFCYPWVVLEVQGWNWFLLFPFLFVGWSGKNGKKKCFSGTSWKLVRKVLRFFEWKRSFPDVNALIDFGYLSTKWALLIYGLTIPWCQVSFSYLSKKKKRKKDKEESSFLMH